MNMTIYRFKPNGIFIFSTTAFSLPELIIFFLPKLIFKQFFLLSFKVFSITPVFYDHPHLQKFGAYLFLVYVSFLSIFLAILLTN